jgi:hypothetical protein
MMEIEKYFVLKYDGCARSPKFANFQISDFIIPRVYET